MPDPCDDGGIDAITVLSTDKILVFRNSHYMILNDNGVEPDYPQPNTNFMQFEGKVDACFSLAATSQLPFRLYLFQGDKVFLYEENSQNLRAGYPKKISDVFHNVPNNVDSAFMWSGNGRIYFTKGIPFKRCHQEIFSLSIFHSKGIIRF